MRTRIARFWQVASILLVAAPFHLRRRYAEAFVRDEGETEQGIARKLGHRLCRTLGLEVEVVGADRLEGLEQHAVVSNHSSYADWIIILGHYPRGPRFVAKKGLTKLPIVGSYLQRWGILIDRASGPAARRVLAEALEEPSPWTTWIFPEGTCSKDGEIATFKQGGAKLIARTGVPLVPVTLVGSYEIFPHGSKLIRRGPARIVIGAPIDPARVGEDEALARVEAEIRRTYAEQRPLVTNSSGRVPEALAAGTSPEVDGAA